MLRENLSGGVVQQGVVVAVDGRDGDGAERGAGPGHLRMEGAV